MDKKLLANLGFLLQLSGLLTLIPIAAGFYFNETNAIVAVLLASCAFLGSGFLLNSLCERKDLDFKSSCVLVVVAFATMGLIGSIPYIYLDPFGSTGVADRITNGLFESISGFTTTGFTMIPELTQIPNTLGLYGSVIELIGGIGIVFLLLVFFQKGSSLDNLRNAVGVEELDQNLRKSYLTILSVYGSFVVFFVAVIFLLGEFDLVSSIRLVIDTLTGGFSPSASTLLSTGIATKMCLLALMLLGSFNFTFIYLALTRKLTWIHSREVQLYLAIIIGSTILFTLSSGIAPFDSLFHIVSMTSSTGFDYIGISTLNQTSLGILIVLTLIGGCGFSMAGGIKVFRLLLFGDSIKGSVVETVRDVEYVPDEKPIDDDNHAEISSANVSIIIFIMIALALTILLTTSGASFSGSLFEIASALSTNGATLGITSATMGIGYKYLIIACMLIGRVEIMTVLVAVTTQRDLFIDLYYSVKRLLKRNV